LNSNGVGLFGLHDVASGWPIVQSRSGWRRDDLPGMKCVVVGYQDPILQSNALDDLVTIMNALICPLSMEFNDVYRWIYI
jgi:hypothetical protein